MDKQTDEKVVLGHIGIIELPKIDITVYIGKRIKIVSADTYKGEYGYYVKVQTKILDTIGTDDRKIELRGSRIFGLQIDADGIIGYGKDTKLGLFLEKMKCKEINDLIDKEVILQSITNNNGIDFLSFN